MRPLDDLLSELERESGTVYAPFVTGLLKPSDRRRQLKKDLEAFRRQACLDMYRRRTELY